MGTAQRLFKKAVSPRCPLARSFNRHCKFIAFVSHMFQYGSRQHQSKLGTGRPLGRWQPAAKVYRAWLGSFTLFELLVTIAIPSLTASLAVPALRDFVLNHRAVGRINQFVAAVNFARSEAVTRGASVTLCSST